MSKLLETKILKPDIAESLLADEAFFLKFVLWELALKSPLSPATQHYGLRMIVFLSRVAAQLITAKNIYPIPCCQVDPWLHNCFCMSFCFLAEVNWPYFWSKNPHLIVNMCLQQGKKRYLWLFDSNPAKLKTSKRIYIKMFIFIYNKCILNK